MSRTKKYRIYDLIPISHNYSVNAFDVQCVDIIVRILIKNPTSTNHRMLSTHQLSKKINHFIGTYLFLFFNLNELLQAAKMFRKFN